MRADGVFTDVIALDANVRVIINTLLLLMMAFWRGR